MIPDESEEIAPRAQGGMGHNLPPSPIEMLVREQREAQDPKKDRLLEIIRHTDAKNVVDRETAGQAGDLIKIALAFEKLVDSDRIERTRPYRDAADAAKAECDQFLEPLREAVENLRARLKQWSDDEDERIEAQRKEQEEFFRTAKTEPPAETASEDTPAETPRPAPPPPNLKPAKRRAIIGDLGARVTQADKKVYRVSDISQVPDFIMNSPTVHDAIIAVVKSMAKHMPDIPGIETTTETDNKIR